MKRLLIAASLILMTINAWAVTTGFSAGNDLTATTIQGDLSVQCQENGQFAFARFSCEMTVLDPAEYSYFVTDSGGDADTITLTATWENGKTVIKKASFNPATGKSKDSFNLWIATLFQRPLLDFGKNKVHFVLSKSGKTRQEGDFIATIHDGPSRRCRNGFQTSFGLNDCRSGGSIVCRNYFDQENYCK